MSDILTTVTPKEAKLATLPDKIAEVLQSPAKWVRVDEIWISQSLVDRHVTSVRDTNPVHTNREYACAKLGLPGTVLPGVQVLGLVTGLFDSVLRDGDQHRRAFVVNADIRFLNPAFLDEFGRAKLVIDARCPSWRLLEGAKVFAKVEFRVAPVTIETSAQLDVCSTGSLFLNFE